MKILSAFMDDDGTVTAMVEVARNGDEVGIQDVTLGPGDDGYEAARAVAESQTQEES